MATFTLSPSSWTQIIASGGSKAQCVNMQTGKAELTFGTPGTVPPFNISQPGEVAGGGCQTIIPAGTEVQARAIGPVAVVRTSDW